MNEKEAQSKNAEGLVAYQAEKYEEAVQLFSEAINLNPDYSSFWLNRSDAYRKLGRIAEADADRNKWLILKRGEEEPILVSETQRVSIGGEEKTVAVSKEKERVDLWVSSTLLVVALLGGWLAAGIVIGINWKKMGKSNLMWLTIVASLAITIAVVFIPWPVEEYIAVIIANVICLGATWGIWLWQRPYYEIRSSGFQPSNVIPIIVVIAVNAIIFGLYFGIGPERISAIESYNRGVELQSRGLHDEALIEYNKAIELDPKFAEAYYNRGWIFTQNFEFDDALADFNKAIELDPKLAPAYYNRGLLLIMMGNLEEATNDFTRCIELSEDEEIIQAAKEWLKMIQ